MTRPSAERSALLDVAQMATWLNLGESTIRDLAARGKVPAYRLGGQWRFDEDEIQAWLQAHRTIVRAEPASTRRRTRQQRSSARPSDTPTTLFPNAPWHPRPASRQSGRRDQSESSR